MLLPSLTTLLLHILIYSHIEAVFESLNYSLCIFIHYFVKAYLVGILSNCLDKLSRVITRGCVIGQELEQSVLVPNKLGHSIFYNLHVQPAKTQINCL